MKAEKIAVMIIALLAISIFPLTTSTKAQTTSTATLSILPTTVNLTQPDETFTLDINITDVSNLWLYDLNVTWNPKVLSLVNSPKQGTFLKQGGSTLYATEPSMINVTSWIEITDALFSSNGVSGSGELASIEFQMTSQSPTTTIQVGNITLQQPLPSGATTGSQHPTISLSSTSSLTATVNFSQGVPAANAGSNQVVKEGQTVQFDGSKSISSGANPTYVWSFTYNGVIQNLTGIKPTFTFSIPGVYIVTLIVSDSFGSSSPVTVTVSVQGPPPTAKITVENLTSGQSVETGQPIVFDGSGSSSSVNGTLSYLWNMGDAFTSTNQTVTHTYAVTGNFNVTLTVTDITGMNDTAVYPITVIAGKATPSPPPTAEPTSSASSTLTGTSSTASPTPVDYAPSGSIPGAVLAIVIIVTIFALGGSTIWLRKRV